MSRPPGMQPLGDGGQRSVRVGEVEGAEHAVDHVVAGRAFAQVRGGVGADQPQRGQVPVPFEAAFLPQWIAVDGHDGCDGLGPGDVRGLAPGAGTGLGGAAAIEVAEEFRIGLHALVPVSTEAVDDGAYCWLPGDG